MDHLESIYNAVLDGDAASAQAGVKAALAANLPADVILKNGLIAAMSEVGRLFEENEYFVPEMLVSARAMQSGLALLKPYLAEAGAEPAGKIIMGTVKGDLHDIGKNLVAMMLEGAGFTIVDLGVDVAPEKYVASVKEQGVKVIGLSALLTTTMPAMKDTIAACKEAGIRDDVVIMIGGAPVTQDYADEIGANGFAPDAASAVDKIKELLAA